MILAEKSVEQDCVFLVLVAKFLRRKFFDRNRARAQSAGFFRSASKNLRDRRAALATHFCRARLSRGESSLARPEVFFSIFSRSNPARPPRRHSRFFLPAGKNFDDRNAVRQKFRKPSLFSSPEFSAREERKSSCIIGNIFFYFFRWMRI